MIMNKNIFDTINRVYEALSDDKSKRVFLARLDYSMETKINFLNGF